MSGGIGELRVVLGEGPYLGVEERYWGVEERYEGWRAVLGEAGGAVLGEGRYLGPGDDSIYKLPQTFIIF